MEYWALGAIGALAFSLACWHIHVRRKEAEHAAEALRAWRGENVSESETSLIFSQDDPANGTRSHLRRQDEN